MNRYPIQRAKVQRPPLRDETLSRDRLLDWMNIKVHHRVLFVTADAGYGKTTLLADFARRTRLKVLWYRLDPGDSSWLTFLSYLVASGREHDPEFATETSRILGDPSLGGPSRDAALRTLVKEIRSLGEQGAVLILDDFDAVDEADDVHGIVSELLTHAPERLTFVFASRKTPSVPVARLRALGELAELTTEELKFNQAETERLFREAYGQALESDVLGDVSARTDGWAASLQLVKAAIRDRTPSEIRNFVRSISGAEGDLYDYLAEEVVGDLSPDLQEFLMRTSLLHEVDPTSARLVADIDISERERLVREAERAGLLGRRAEGSRRGRAYHPLVREFLVQRLERDRGPGFLRSLHEDIARRAWPPEWIVACQHFSVAEKAAEVHRVLDEAAGEILSGGQVAAAEDLLRRHPPEVPTANLEMIASRGDFQTGRLSDALRRARRAVELDPTSDLASANLSSLRIMLGELNKGQELAGSLAERSRNPDLRSIAQATHDMLLLSIDDRLEPFVVGLMRMADRQRISGQSHYEGVSLLNAAIVLRAQGDAARCLTLSRQAVLALEQSSSGQELVSANLVGAWASAHLGQWDEALLRLASVRTRPGSSVHAEALSEAAAIHLWYGDRETARGLLAEVEASTDVRPDILDIWRLSALELAIRDNDLRRCGDLVDQLEVGELSPEPAHQARQKTLSAYSGLAQGIASAREGLDEAIGLAERQGAGFWANYGRVLAGAFAGDADTFNRTALRVSRDDRAYLSVLAEPITARLDEAGSDLLAEVAAEAQRRPERWRPILRSHVDDHRSKAHWPAARILDRVGAPEDVGRLREVAKGSKATSIDRSVGKGLARSLAERVTIEDLGRVAVRIGNRVIPGSDVRRKVLALACYLASKPGLSATRDQVLDAIWPDLEPSVALNSLNQTIYFLRRVFEPDYQEDISPDYIRHDSNVVWLDQELVRTRSAECWDLIRQVASDRSTDDVASLSATYMGRFALDFEYEEWAMTYRESLHAAYLQVIESTVSADMSSGFYTRGIALARRALDIDPDAEQLEVSLLRLYRNSGAHAAAAEQYAHYASAVRTELGIDPPPLEAI